MLLLRRTPGGGPHAPGTWHAAPGHNLDAEASAQIGELAEVGEMGEMGEIAISGGLVNIGYLNSPALTASRFVVLERAGDDQGQADAGVQCSGVAPPADKCLWFLTGDLGRWDADGTLHFGGRVDRQLKIRGMRIEPREIEVRLMSRM